MTNTALERARTRLAELRAMEFDYDHRILEGKVTQ